MINCKLNYALFYVYATIEFELKQIEEETLTCSRDRQGKYIEAQDMQNVNKLVGLLSLE